MDTANRHFHAAGDRDDRDLLLQLQDLFDGNPDVQEFLSELAIRAARKLSSSLNEVSCGVTVIRRKKPMTLASSDPRARTLDELQNSFGDGPCLTALREQTTILVPNVLADNRWAEYLHAAAVNGVSSILAVPMDVKGTGQAALNLYSPRTHGFPEESLMAAEAVAAEAARALHLALKIAQLTELRDNLTAALETRTTIATAVGVIMAENRCSRERAFQILVNACSHRNVKMHPLAESIISRVAGEDGSGPRFDE